MSRFSGSAPARKSVTVTTGPARTAQGGRGFSYDSRTDLFTLCVGSLMSGSDSFYESGKLRDVRLATLTHDVASTLDGFAWLCRFVPYLRNTLGMRTAAVMVAVEAAYKASQVGFGSAEFTPRRVIDASVARADEFAEVIGYHRARYGRTIPSYIKRGLSDAMNRVLTEYSFLKYDGSRDAMRIGFIISLIHPSPKDPAQSDLYRYALARFHNGASASVDMSRLPMVAARDAANRIPSKDRLAIARSPEFPDFLRKSGMTWENVAGWLETKLSAKDWELVIPQMGYLALLRNLRNFDDAGISDAAARKVGDILSDPDNVRKSKVFPYQFLTAYRAAEETMRWAQPLASALDNSLSNVPELKGDSLIAVDTSGSMGSMVSGKSSVACVEIGALMGTALRAKNPGSTLVAFADDAYEVQLPTQRNVLRNVQHIRNELGRVGYGTNVRSALAHFDPTRHRRIIILSDMQDAYGIYGARSIPESVPVYSFNLAGYAGGIIDTSKPNRFVVSGFTDAAFTMIDQIEHGRSQDWPF